ncbi:MAG: SDR family NAD(P)-dependent oxidoreductase [Bacteroidota bacterium]
MEIKGSKVFLTGGSLGIGKATAKMLVDKGAQVVITGRNKERLESAAAETGAIPMVYDMADYEAAQTVLNQAVEKMGGIDVLINNAGIGNFPTLEDLEIEHFEKVFSVNVFGLAMLTKAAAVHFRQQNYGNIINIASTAALKGFARGTVYASSKFAVRCMTQCWQAELRKHNVRVILVNPSEVTTAFANPERKERDTTPKKLRSEEIAHTIVSTLEMDDRGFIPEVTVWATNPWE